MNEEWRDIFGYEGYYQVSNRGRVYSQPREGTRGGILKPQPCSDGHLQVQLYKNGVRDLCLVHRLVAEAFLGPCPAGQEVCHGPNGLIDNSVENLYYGTHAENMADTVRDGTHTRGSRNGRAKLTEAQIAEILISDLSGSALARQFGVAPNTVNRIRQGLTWKHIHR